MGQLFAGQAKRISDEASSHRRPHMQRTVSVYPPSPGEGSPWPGRGPVQPGRVG